MRTSVSQAHQPHFQCSRATWLAATVWTTQGQSTPIAAGTSSGQRRGRVNPKVCRGLSSEAEGSSERRGLVNRTQHVPRPRGRQSSRQWLSPAGTQAALSDILKTSFEKTPSDFVWSHLLIQNKRDPAKPKTRTPAMAGDPGFCCFKQRSSKELRIATKGKKVGT